MQQAMTERNNKMHPHKFTLWVAIGSIVMMFAGFTSAYIVKSNQANWQPVQMPVIFYASTALILLSSLTMQLALRSFKEREMARYRTMMAVTLLLGISFIVVQSLGFAELWATNITFRESIAGSFFYIITGMHALHVLGGVIALLVIFFRVYHRNTRYYSVVPVEVMSTYWHFVDILWLYLFVFFMLVS